MQERNPFRGERHDRRRWISLAQLGHTEDWAFLEPVVSKLTCVSANSTTPAAGVVVRLTPGALS